MNLDYNKIEDAIFKKAMEFFKDNAILFFGLDTKILTPAETEIKNIDIKTNYADYLFYTEDGSYLHFEFQSTDKPYDLKRFLYYDASLYYKEGRRIKTIVIYSSDIESVSTSLDAGTIKYSIEAFFMNKIDGDTTLNILRNKIQNHSSLSGQDILSLSLLPLMRGTETKSKRLIESIELSNNIADSDQKVQCQSILYALLDKFGDNEAKKRFKEVISMTDIGRMIYEDGVAEGKAKGIAEGKAEGETGGKADLLIKLLIKKFKTLPQEYKDKIKQLPMDSLEIIATDIFDLEKVQDLEKYFM